MSDNSPKTAESTEETITDKEEFEQQVEVAAAILVDQEGPSGGSPTRKRKSEDSGNESGEEDSAVCFRYKPLRLHIKELEKQEQDQRKGKKPRTARICSTGLCKFRGTEAVWRVTYENDFGISYCCDWCKDNAEDRWIEVEKEYEEGAPEFTSLSQE
jgi:hypothetical protein